MSGNASATAVSPAKLSFFAIYNPYLSGESDDKFQDQIVYFFEETKHGFKEARKAGTPEQKSLHAASNKQLRSIGLIQAMIQFARLEDASILL